MKILFCPCHYVYDEKERGSELSWSFNIADKIAAEYPKSTVVTGFKNLKEKKKYKVVELQKGRRSIDMGILNSLRFNFAYTRYMRQTLSHTNFDLIHHVLPFGIDSTFNLALIFNMLGKTPYIVGPLQLPLPYFRDNLDDAHKKSVKKIDINFFLQNIFKGITRRLSDMTLHKAQKIIVVNDAAASLLIKKGIPKRKITLIPPGINTALFSPTTASRKGSVIRILCVTALMERKSVDLVLKAIGIISKTQKKFSVVIVGDGPQREKLEDLTKKLKIEKFITFIGLVPYTEMSKFYKQADIFVTMSKAESFATVCLESMASGLAVISSRVGGFEDIIINHGNGILVNQGDYKKLAKELLHLIKNPTIIKQLGRRARSTVVKGFDWKRSIIPEYLKVYKEVLNEKKS